MNEIIKAVIYARVSSEEQKKITAEYYNEKRIK